MSQMALPPDFPLQAQDACSGLVVLFFVLIASQLMVSTLRWESDRWAKGTNHGAGLLSGTLLAGAVLFLCGRAGLWRGGPVAVVFTANLLLAASLAGSRLASGIRRPSELLPVCAVACAADWVSFSAGPTAAAVQQVAAYYAAGMAGPAPWADYLLVKIPVPGGAGFAPVFGVTDWVVAACLTSASRRLSLDFSLRRDKKRSRVLEGLAGAMPPPAVTGLLAAMALAHATGRFVPGMPLMVMVYLPLLLARSPQARRPRVREIGLTLLFPAVIFLMGRFLQV